MSMYEKTHYNTVISLQLIKINETKQKNKKTKITYTVSSETTYEILI